VLRFLSENVNPHSRYMPPKLLEFRERMLRNIEGLKRSARLRSESAMPGVLALLRRVDVSDREISFRTITAIDLWKFVPKVFTCDQSCRSMEE
jgi:hypothetical protein